MPKRKRDKRSDDDFQYFSNKIRKLERKLKRGRRPNKNNDKSSCDEMDHSPQNLSERNLTPVCDDDYTENDSRDPPTISDIVDVTNMQLTTTVPTPLLGSVPGKLPVILDAAQPSTSTAQVVDVDATPELDEEIMLILGGDPSFANNFGKEIQKDLAVRLNHIAINGLSTDTRKELKDKYLVPENCKLIKAPILNAELCAALSEPQLKRDKGIEYKQSMTACGLSSLSQAITILLASDVKNTDLLKNLMDTARIMSDIQFNDSVSRRKFILTTLKKELKDQLEKTRIDESLFGLNLPETLKSAKSISKSGAELRSASSQKPFTANKSKFIPTTGKPLNWRAPPPNRRPAPSGTQRSAKPATSRPPTHNSSFKTSSYRQTYPPSRPRR